MIDKYLDFYKKFVTEGYNIYPNDEKILEKRGKLIHYDCSISHENFVNAFSTKDRIKIADYMLPDPFVGDVRNSKIFFITANPKLAGIDYDIYKEERFNTPEFLNYCTKQVLLQDRNFLDKYPFWTIHDDFNYTGGYKWWYKRRGISKLINKLNMNLWNVSTNDAVNRFARLFTNIELLPYRSVNFDIDTARQLEAYKMNKCFIEEYLIPKAVNGEILLIFSWGANQFNIPASNNIYVFPPKQAQGLTFNPDASKVQIGRVIYNFINEKKL